MKIINSKQIRHMSIQAKDELQNKVGRYED